MKTQMFKKIKKSASSLLIKLWRKKKTIKKEETPLETTRIKEQETKDITTSTESTFFELSPMNKSTIVLHSPPFLIIKLRNISKSMRRRVKYILKKRSIYIRSIERTNAFLINGWASYSNEDLKVIKNHPRKVIGVQNYSIREQKDIDEILKLNGSLRCSVIGEEPFKPNKFEFVSSISVFGCSYDSTIKSFSNLTFERIGYLLLCKLSETQIKNSFPEVTNISEISITKSKFATLDLSKFGIRKVEFDEIEFSGTVKLPDNVVHLMIFESKHYHHIKYKNVTILEFFKNDQPTLKDLNWIKNMHSLKEIHIERTKINDLSPYLPFSLRLFYSNEKIQLDWPYLKNNFPYLKQVIVPMKISEVEQFQPKILKCPLEDDMFDPVSARPKTIRLMNSNYEAIGSHFELFEKAEKVEIDLEMFDLRRLPSTVKYISLSKRFCIG